MELEREQERSCVDSITLDEEPPPKKNDWNDQSDALFFLQRFYDQIRYGCTNTACEASTCLSYQKRQHGGRPFFRRKTPAMARAMAVVMAAENNPYTRLCPNPQALKDVGDTEQKDTIDYKSISQQLFSTTIWNSAFRGEYQPHGHDDGEREPEYSIQRCLEASRANIIEAGSAMRGLVRKSRPQVFSTITQCLAKYHISRYTTLTPDAGLLCILKTALAAVISDFLPTTLTDSELSAHQLEIDQMFIRELDRNPRLLQTIRLIDDLKDPERDKHRRDIIECATKFEDSLACNCVKIFVRVLYCWRHYKKDTEGIANAIILESKIIEYLTCVPDDMWHDEKFSTARVVLIWAQTVMRKEFNDKTFFVKSSCFGCALDFISLLYRQRSKLLLNEHAFELGWLNQAFRSSDWVDVWLSFKTTSVTGNSDHLLTYPWLFRSSDVVTYFRTINFSTLQDSYDESSRILQMQSRIRNTILERGDPIHDQSWSQWNFEADTTKYLVIHLNRDTLVENAMDELWRRERRDLLKPLRVILQDEMGHDAGGLQQEFFRLAFVEILNPDYGLFTIDDATSMAWFGTTPGLPSYKMAMVGLLMGLAVYNNITLSITLPLMFYRKLLGLPVNSIDHIRDGWPELARSFDQLLGWSDGPIEDWAIDWTFTADRIGEQVHYNLETNRHTISQPGHPAVWPPGEEPKAVTEANRASYVAAYISFLGGESVSSAFTPFSNGFLKVVHRASLTLFDPVSLKRLVEGTQEIDVFALKRATKYSKPYHGGHQIIVWFWEVVMAYSVDELKALLQFVRASERIPVRGMSEIEFVIDKTGEDDNRLPSSSTCFGQLKLPEYSSRETLKRNLMFSITNTEGFGLV